MKYIIILMFAFVGNILIAQSLVKMPISFVPIYENKPLVLNQSYHLTAKDSLEIETLKFYISNIELYQDETKVHTEENSFYLVDASDSSSLKFELNIPKKLDFSHIQFNLGIDSLTNMSGALGGDLDPTKGMYWTWQSGYINFKLEGTSSVCPTRHHFFQFHLGGYAFPNNSLQTIRLEKKERTKNQDIEIKIDLSTFTKNVSLAKQNQVMSLGKEAVNLSKKVAQIFSIL